MSPSTSLEQRCIDTIRTLAMDIVQKANSGHPGLPMGCSAIAHVLWSKHLRYHPRNPLWPNRDRFVLSAGHGSALLYIMLHLTGYDLPMSELQRFRQLHSRTPGHPEHGLTPGVEATTGPLGQGFANGVGFALAKRLLADRFNTAEHHLVDHRVYAIVSDGDLMEGISHEAASLAGHLGLGELVYVYDDNHISLDGPTEDTFTDDTLRRFDAYGWHTQRVADGHDPAAVDAALEAAKSDPRPSLIACRTHIGYGSPHKQDTAKAHGSPLGEDEVRLTKQAIGWDPDAHFFIPDDVLTFYRQALDKGACLEQEWDALVRAWSDQNPELARVWERERAGELPKGWAESLPRWEAGDSQSTRVASGQAINALATILPNLVGGSADLKSSNETWIDGHGYFEPGHVDRNLAFGVREHAMCGVLNGMGLYGGLEVFGGTFLCFSDYARPSIRLASLTGIPVIYVFTHDSIGLGEDGPTHQPVEHHMALRAMPNLWVVRPGDANETSYAWRMALGRRDGPVLLELSRQKLPVFTETADDAVLNGGYVMRDAPEGLLPDVLLIATGSELQLAVAAQARLAEEGVRARVVSLPCWEVFDRQDEAYRHHVLPPDVLARVSVEAGVTQGWERYLGTQGVAVGIDHYGASAPEKALYQYFNITTDHVVEAARQSLARTRAAAGLTA
ncbi:MAG TPA: transketolase [Candidatus Dormibacteraeota bacterium]